MFMAGFQAYKDMHMVCNPVYDNRFLVFAFYDTCHVFENIIAPGLL